MDSFITKKNLRYMTNQMSGKVVVNGTYLRVSYALLYCHAEQNKEIFEEHLTASRGTPVENHCFKQ